MPALSAADLGGRRGLLREGNRHDPSPGTARTRPASSGARRIPACRLVRLQFGAWDGKPFLSDAFLGGYGRALTADEEFALRDLRSLSNAVSAIWWGSANNDADIMSRGYRTLAQLLRVSGDAWPSSCGPMDKYGDGRAIEHLRVPLGSRNLADRPGLASPP